MKQQKRTITELATAVREEMERLGYSEATMVQVKRKFTRLERYAEGVGEQYFSEDIALAFLKDVYGFEVENLYQSVERKHLKHYMRCMRLLYEFQKYGVVCRRQRGDLARAELSEKLQEALDSFNDRSRDEGKSESTIYFRGNRIKRFLLFLDENGIRSCSGIGAGTVSDYLVSNASLHPKTISSIITSLRCFLRHIYLEGIIEKDLTVTIPASKRYYAPSLPTAWTDDDINKLFTGIDRGNPNGKRDYVILLMVARLGLRACDIKALKLENLKWNTKTIEFVQHKTKVPLTLPILDDIGWALIDYLRNGRPATNCPHVFVRHITPFESFLTTSNLTYILARQLQLVGIPTSNGPKTLHSLRHSLASSLLRQQVPLEDIMGVLGHVSQRTTSLYLHLDDDGLRRCALDPEMVITSG